MSLKNNVKTRIGTILTAYLLLTVLVLPNLNQWAHLANGHHNEERCVESKSHFHAEELSCALTATFTTPFTFFKGVHYVLLDNSLISQPAVERPQHLQLKSIQEFYLRGPPFLLLSA